MALDDMIKWAEEKFRYVLIMQYTKSNLFNNFVLVNPLI